jgi:hypothetical protein
MSAKGKKSGELKRLQERLARNHQQGNRDEGELMSNLLKNIQSQWLLSEWQELLRVEQRILLGRMKLDSGPGITKAKEIRD